jgi:hypothetical protein
MYSRDYKALAPTTPISFLPVLPSLLFLFLTFVKLALLATQDMDEHLSSPLPGTKVWKSLLKCLPPGDSNVEFWWQLTGSRLAEVVGAADYSVERQYEILLFHYYWIVSTCASPFFIGFSDLGYRFLNSGQRLE